MQQPPRTFLPLQQIFATSIWNIFWRCQVQCDQIGRFRSSWGQICLQKYPKYLMTFWGLFKTSIKLKMVVVIFGQLI